MEVNCDAPSLTAGTNSMLMASMVASPSTVVVSTTGPQSLGADVESSLLSSNGVRRARLAIEPRVVPTSNVTKLIVSSYKGSLKIVQLCSCAETIQQTLARYLGRISLTHASNCGGYPPWYLLLKSRESNDTFNVQIKLMCRTFIATHLSLVAGVRVVQRKRGHWWRVETATCSSPSPCSLSL